MLFNTIHHEHNRAWAIWQLDEDESALIRLLDGMAIVPEEMTNLFKRLEFLGGRVLVKEVLNSMGQSYQGIRKDEFGKPFPIGCDYQLSLTHSYPYVAVLLDKVKAAGIDLEQPKAKLLKIAPRVLSTAELIDAGDAIVKHCIYWSAKETLVKVYGKKDLIFTENLKIDSFLLKQEGDILGRIIVEGEETTVPLQYYVFTDFVLVYSK
ncbi:MAG: hypothetical protein JNM57_09310 [Cyclobacteriaceae bacterium]|nr:hypothetical protein [Cyclobacteriaceae bacterium]